jgi:hypothetical protein
MKNTSSFKLYSTGICEKYYSKRTLVSVISNLKDYLPDEIHTITKDGVQTSRFRDIINQDGCIFLKGPVIPGISLHDIYRDYTQICFSSDETKRFLNLIVLFIETVKKYSLQTGSFPQILLNGILIDKGGTKVTLLPPSIIDYLNKYQSTETQRLLFFSTGGKKNPIKTRQNVDAGIETDQTEFTLSLARLIYLFFTKPKPSPDTEKQSSFTHTDNGEMPIFYLRSCVDDIPKELADTIWALMHGRIIKLQELTKIIQMSIHSVKTGLVTGKIPFLKRRGVIFFQHRLSVFLSHRWRYIPIVLILLGVVSYLLSDALRSRTRIDYTLGLSAVQVVELYYSSINNLNLDAIDSLFFKRSGKKIKNELSTVYVMMKMEQAFGKQLVSPDTVPDTTISLDYYSVYGIKDLVFEQISNGDDPVFIARYMRVISSADSINEYVTEEKLYLKKIKDRWYITESIRSILENQ